MVSVASIPGRGCVSSRQDRAGLSRGKRSWFTTFWPHQNVIFDHFLSEPSHIIWIKEVNESCLQMFSVTESRSPYQEFGGVRGWYSVGKTLPFSHTAARALTVVIDNYIHGCTIFLFMVRLAAFILLEVLLILLPLDFYSLLVESKVSYLPKE